jgi:hypothetical protein
MRLRLPILALASVLGCNDGGHAAPPPRSAAVTVPSASPSEKEPWHAPMVGEVARPESVPTAAAPEQPPAEAPPGPAVDAPQGDTCGLRARLRALPSTDGFPHYALTLTNGGKKPVRLVIPGDGSEVGWRTPMLTWIATANGKPAAPAEAGRCGLSNAIAEDEIFDLPPGQSREIKEWLGYPRFVPGTYDIKLRYRNDPSILARKAGMSPAVAQKIAGSSTCDVTTNAVVTTLKP